MKKNQLSAFPTPPKNTQSLDEDFHYIYTIIIEDDNLKQETSLQKAFETMIKAFYFSSLPEELPTFNEFTIEIRATDKFNVGNNTAVTRKKK